MGPKNKPPMQLQGEIYLTLPLERFLDATIPQELLGTYVERGESEINNHAKNLTLVETIAADGWTLKMIVPPTPLQHNGFAIYAKSALFEFRPDPATEDKK